VLVGVPVDFDDSLRVESGRLMEAIDILGDQ
jgi:hypothetical protein